MEQTKLTPELLLELGFVDRGINRIGNRAYRFEVPRNKRGYYGKQLQMTLRNDFPEDNGNSGILSVYVPEDKGATVIGGTFEEETMDFPAQEMPIAYHVTTLERLNAIYTALTCNPPLTIKESV